MQTPTTYEEYLAQLNTRRSWFERLIDSFTGRDEQLNLLARIQLEQNQILRTGLLEVPLLTERSPYLIREYDLSTARTNEEVSISGTYLAFSTDGDTSEISVRINNPTNDSVLLLNFNGLNVRFDSFYLTNTAQSGKTLKVFIGSRSTAGAFTPIRDSSGNIGILIKGNYDGEPLTLAVDANGNIVSLMKGEYSGSLKTIATDTQGRMLAVITDPEDVWGNPHQMGNAELAARLGSIVTHDRRGTLIWFDGFEGGVDKWTLWGSGTGNTQEWSAETARTGDFSVKLTCGDNGGHGHIGRYESFPILSNLGLEASVKIDTDVTSVEWIIVVYSGTQFIRYSVRYVASTDVWQYADSSGVWQNTGTTRDLRTTDTAFHEVKLVVDAVNAQYIRLIVDDLEIDLSGISAQSGTSSASPTMYVEVDVVGTTGANAVGYVDDVILTQDE